MNSILPSQFDSDRPGKVVQSPELHRNGPVANEAKGAGWGIGRSWSVYLAYRRTHVETGLDSDVHCHN